MVALDPRWGYLYRVPSTWAMGPQLGDSARPMTVNYGTRLP